jgi:hypothetical protein
LPFKVIQESSITLDGQPLEKSQKVYSTPKAYSLPAGTYSFKAKMLTPATSTNIGGSL